MICSVKTRYLDLQKIEGKKEVVASEGQCSPSLVLQALAEYLLCARQMCQVLGDKNE